MPGIVGLITKMPRAWAEPHLLRMLESMRHKSSYETGTWIDEELGLYIGWTVRKNSFARGMPLYNERRDVVLVFSGEEYPDPETAVRLKQQRHVLEPDRPSYLVHLSEEDPKFPACLNGRFHGCLIDRTSGSVKLFNDRYGMHRLCYHESPDAFYFAAEAKAILAVRPELRSADPQGLGEFVACGCVLENRTLFKGIEVMPPASAWTFAAGELSRKEAYFDPAEWENQTPLDAESYYQQLKLVFTRNLARYFNGKEKIGISLTGGFDTRMIMAWCHVQDQSLPSYTFGGPVRECQDVIIARNVARVCRQPYQVIPLGDTFFSRFPHYAERTVYLSDGCAAVNRAADLYANEIAAEIAPVRMTGNYGSEILRRLRAFKPTMPPPGLFQPDFMREVVLAKQTYEKHIQGHAVSFTAFRQAPWHQHGLLALEETQLTLRSPYLDNDLVRTAFCAPNSAMPKNDIFEDNNDCARLIGEGNAALTKVRTDRGRLGDPSVSWLTPIARSWLEFTFRAEYAYDYGMPQWLARIDHVLSPLHLEHLFLGRHKFCHYRIWYRDQLSQYVREMLLDSRTLARPYIERKAVERIVHKHVSGEANYTTAIHQMLTLELVHRQFLDGR